MLYLLCLLVFLYVSPSCAWPHPTPTERTFNVEVEHQIMRLEGLYKNDTNEDWLRLEVQLCRYFLRLNICFSLASYFGSFSSTDSFSLISRYPTQFKMYRHIFFCAAHFDGLSQSKSLVLTIVDHDATGVADFHFLYEAGPVLGNKTDLGTLYFFSLS